MYNNLELSSGATRVHQYDLLVKQIEEAKSPSKKQKLFDDYQNSLINNIDICGEENFEFFKELCRDKLNITEEK